MANRSRLSVGNWCGAEIGFTPGGNGIKNKAQAVYEITLVRPTPRLDNYRPR
jgi:hypothetical protein